MKQCCTILLLLVCAATVSAQSIKGSSNLPLVIINTFGVKIPNDPKIPANMGIIYNGEGNRNRLTDSFNEYNGNIGIEVRGQSSQMFPMKSYSIELRDQNQDDSDVSLFGLPEESDWILYAPYNDKTLMHNVLAYDLSNTMGHWAAHTKYVEVILNGEYIGIYVFEEKIKRNKGRVNIKKLESGDTTADKITGGYMFSLDKDPDAWFSKYAAPNTSAKVHFKYEYPKAEDIVPSQKTYIKNYMDSFETALHGDAFQDTAAGFRHFADENSFIDYFIIDELSHNVDGYHISTYMYKDRNDVNRKIIMGPVWDYDIAFRNANYCDGSDTTGWAYRYNYVCPPFLLPVPFWWDRLMQDTAFESNLLCRWQQLRQTTLSVSNLYRIIDSAAAVTAEARERHFKKWPVLGKYVWPNPSPIPKTYEQEIKVLKYWLKARMEWIDANLTQTGPCKNQHIANTFSAAIKEEANTFSISPNPGSSAFIISGKSVGNIQMQVYTQPGVRLLNTVGDLHQLSQSLSNVMRLRNAGLYIVRLQTNSQVQTIKLIRE